MWLFDHVVFLSNQSDRDRFYDRMMAERLNYKAFSVIPNGVELQDILNAPSDFRARFGVETEHMLLCVGSYSELKNEKFVLLAFMQAKPENSTLVFIGARGNPYMMDLKQMWEKNKRLCGGCRVAFLHGLAETEVLSAYKAADIFLSGSTTECFPIVILQAMAAGVPFISTRVGCVKSLPGGNVIETVPEMAQRILEYLSNGQYRKKLGTDGNEAVKTKYAWPNIVQQYNKLFKSLHQN